MLIPMRNFLHQIKILVKFSEKMSCIVDFIIGNLSKRQIYIKYINPQKLMVLRQTTFANKPYVSTKTMDFNTI